MACDRDGKAIHQGRAWHYVGSIGLHEEGEVEQVGETHSLFRSMDEFTLGQSSSASWHPNHDILMVYD